MSLQDWLLDPSGLTPHGFCLSWAPGLIWLHAGSDAVVGLAYFSIPVALAYFYLRRRDLKYGWLLYLFMAFIFACGTTHLMSIFTLWVPAYGIREGIIKLVTALLSIATAAILWPLIPKLVALPSPAQLQRVNAELSQTLAAKDEVVGLLRHSEQHIVAANQELERRVAEQTTELREANERLSGALKQRDILLREVYHRVKNNLQIVDSLLVLQERQISDPDAKTSLLGLRQRIYALGLVHNQLMDSRDLQTFDIAPFLQQLSTNLLESGDTQGISMSVEAAPMNVGLDFAIPLGLLVTELVTNALKHAFPDRPGNIEVTLKRDGDGEVALVVADDGRGRRRSEAAASPSRPGLGAGIIAGLVAQLEGTISTRDEGGTRVEIRLAAPASS